MPAYLELTQYLKLVLYRSFLKTISLSIQNYTSGINQYLAQVLSESVTCV